MSTDPCCVKEVASYMCLLLTLPRLIVSSFTGGASSSLRNKISEQVTRLPGYQVIRFPGSQVTRLPGYQVIRFPGYQVPRLPGSQVTRLPGYQVTRLPGYQVTRLPGYQVIRYKNGTTVSQFRAIIYVTKVVPTVIKCAIIIKYLNRLIVVENRVSGSYHSEK